jgi:hypothetical protein
MSLLHTIQAMAQAVALETGLSLSDAALWFAGGAIAFFSREIYSFKREVLRWQAKIDTTLFGPEGQNGMHGTVKDHELRIRLLEADHHTH